MGWVHHQTHIFTIKPEPYHPSCERVGFADCVSKIKNIILIESVLNEIKVRLNSKLFLVEIELR